MSSARADLYSKKMGELLLKGWRMLGEDCPLTGEVPLMQHPATGRKFSIAAGQYTDEMECSESDGSAARQPPGRSEEAEGEARAEVRRLTARRIPVHLSTTRARRCPPSSNWHRCPVPLLV
eukprot:scaffold5880_cov32-Tisochrysis_lutea.AAC.8